MNTNNTVRPVDSINIVTVITDETQVNVTRPVTNVVRVVGPGPIGPVGPQGIQGETGLTVTDLFVARGNDTWSTTGSLQISGSLIVSQSVTGLSGFTGSLLGTAATASYFAGYGNSTVLINQHETYNTFTGSIQTQVDGISNATSSYVLNSVTSSMLQPYVLTSVTQSMLQPYVLTSVTSSMIVSGALTASFVNTLNQQVVITGSLNVSGSVFIPALTNDGQLYVLTYNTTSGRVYYTGSTSIGGVPQGATGQIQYNNNQLLGGVPTLIYTDSLLKATGSFSGSFNGSGSGNFNGTFIGNFTGSLLGTAATASFITSSNVLGPHSFNSILSASYALTSSYVNVLTQNVTISGSLFISGSTVQTGNINITGNTILSGSNIITGSSTLKGNLEITGSANISGSVTITGSLTADFAYLTGSLLGTAATASFVTSSNVQGPHGMNSVVSASYALTSSYVNALTQDVTISGSLFISGSTTQTGNVTVTGDYTQIGNTILSGSSIITGSNILIGQSQITGSVNVSGSVVITGSLTANFAYLTGSLLGTAATASFVTSSNVQGPHGMNSVVSASYAVTASYVNILTQDVTISGSLFISGSTVQTGNVTLQGNHVQAGTMILSGSNVITGSLSLVGDARVTGSLLLTQSHISTVDYIDYRVIQTHPSHLEGRTHWLDDTKTLQIDTDVNNFSIEVGHQNIVRARNVTGFDLVAGKVVYINGESGNRPTITTASWDGDSTSAATLGFVAQQINDNQTGYVVTNGMLRGIDTTDFAPGTQLYLSSSGNYTSTVPISPKHEVRLGKTITQANDGVIYVDVMNGYELGELHDVLINSSTNGDLVVKSGSLWINSKQLTGSYGLTGSLNVTGSTTIIGRSVISGSLTVTGSLYANFGYLTGSLLGTAATASFVTSSNVQGPYGMNSVVSASHAVTVRSYAQLIGDGATSNITVTHGLGTNDLHITVYSASGNFENIIPDIHRTDVNTIQVRFVNPPTLNQYRVYISV